MKHLPPASPSFPQVLKRIPIREGRPFPLGATWDGLGVNFALFSANATKVELCLFDIEGKRELERIELPEYTDEVWHGYLPEVRPGADRDQEARPRDNSPTGDERSSRRR